ncbi:uncharacterized protein [Hemitrygon akajei]|uniref:uncharacterized protein isoform X2 n=1 Tax=Hemitrygon akajei TaxID=2704970 RepID=UPI003BF9E3B8
MDMKWILQCRGPADARQLHLQELLAVAGNTDAEHLHLRDVVKSPRIPTSIHLQGSQFFNLRGPTNIPQLHLRCLLALTGKADAEHLHLSDVVKGACFTTAVHLQGWQFFNLRGPTKIPQLHLRCLLALTGSANVAYAHLRGPLPVAGDPSGEQKSLWAGYRMTSARCRQVTRSGSLPLAKWIAHSYEDEPCIARLASYQSPLSARSPLITCSHTAIQYSRHWPVHPAWPRHPVTNT